MLAKHFGRMYIKYRKLDLSINQKPTARKGRKRKDTMNETNNRHEYFEELKSFISALSDDEKEKAYQEIRKLERNRREKEFVISAEVYAGKHDPECKCSNDGCTAHYKDLYVFSEKISLTTVLVYIDRRGLDPFQCVQMENRRPCGEDYYNAIPVLPSLRKKWHMFGGAYIKTSDSRFSEVTGIRYPVPVHDRIEFYN